MSAVITQLSAESLKHFFFFSPPLPQISLVRLVFLDPAVLSLIDVFFFFLFLLFFLNPKYKLVFLPKTLHSLRVIKPHLPERQREPSGSATFSKKKKEGKIAETQNHKFSRNHLFTSLLSVAPILKCFLHNPPVVTFYSIVVCSDGGDYAERSGTGLKTIYSPSSSQMSCFRAGRGRC